MNTYLRLPVTFARGEGVWLWDEEGKRYLDALRARLAAADHLVQPPADAETVPSAEDVEFVELPAEAGDAAIVSLRVMIAAQAATSEESSPPESSTP